MNTIGKWEWDRDYNRAYAPTDDPRVIAVIERDERADAPGGDMAPAYWASAIPGEYIQHAAYSRGTNDRYFIERFREADARLRGSEIIDRWARIFHDTAVQIIPTSRYRNDTPLIVLDTPEYRDLVGITGGPDKRHLDGEIEELRAWIAGDVFGVGYGVLESRVTDETPIDIDEFDVTIECWGFYGEDYATETAERFDYGTPTLAPLLDMSAVIS